MSITLPQFQQLIRDLYGAKDSRRGVEGTFMWFMEEVGELSAALRGGTHEQRALEQLDVNVLSRVDLLSQLAAPGPEEVRPAFDGELPKSDPVNGKRSEPAIAVVIECEPRRRPSGVARPFVDRAGGKLIVSLFEDVGTDPDRIADDPLHRVSPPIHLRCHALDRQVLQATCRHATIALCH